MFRGTTWEGVEYLAVTKVQIRIALPGHPPHPGGAAPRSSSPVIKKMLEMEDTA